MSGILTLVGTPIGNLDDLSPRAIEALKECDFIAAEDTRVAMRLLSNFEIKKPLISYFEHNMHEKGQILVDRIEAGENCCLVTDAGMPAISDPGEDIVKICAERGITVTTCPGPTALVTALALSGISTGRFAFEGFLSTNKVQRKEHLSSLVNDTHTLIFYEAPHKLINTLDDLLFFFGDRKISLCRELTKPYEEIIRTTVQGAVNLYKQIKPRGEYVLIIEGATLEKNEGYTLESAIEFAKDLAEKGSSISEAAKNAAKVTGFKKGDIYKALLN